MEYIVLFGIFYLMRKISASTKSEPQVISPKDIKSLINKAISKGKKLRIGYECYKNDIDHTVVTNRVVLPLKIDSGDKFVGKKYDLNANKLYLNAFCELRDEERHFRLDRIVSAEMVC